MDLKQLLASLEHSKRAPTAQWDPPYCGEVPIHINEQGEWLYKNSTIVRSALVKLFASVLVCEGDDYFLITPAEKVKITVADVPFVITEWRWDYSAESPVLVAVTNLGDEVPVSEKHPIFLRNDIPYVNIDAKLLARVHRNVYYQWIDEALQKRTTDVATLTITSAGKQFVLGQMD